MPKKLLKMRPQSYRLDRIHESGLRVFNVRIIELGRENLRGATDALDGILIESVR